VKKPQKCLVYSGVYSIIYGISTVFQHKIFLVAAVVRGIAKMVPTNIKGFPTTAILFFGIPTVLYVIAQTPRPSFPPVITVLDSGVITVYTVCYVAFIVELIVRSP
jgi:hypothetical protein